MFNPPILTADRSYTNEVFARYTDTSGMKYDKIFQIDNLLIHHTYDGVF